MDDFISTNLSFLEKQKSDPVIDFKSPVDLKKDLEEIKIKYQDSLHNLDQLSELFQFIYQNSVKTQSKYFLNQLYANCHPLALLGDLLATHLNTSPYTYQVAPLFSLMELDLNRTLQELFHLNSESDFITIPGASYGNLMSHYLAREIKQITSEDIILYTPLSHYSIQHARKIIGFSKEQMIPIPLDNQGQISLINLKELVSKLLDLKKKIKLVHLTAGTTVYGTFDSILDLLKIKKEFQLDFWIHLDAALGGSVIFSPNDQKLLAGIAEVDSFIWNLHKLPGGSGAPLQSSLLVVKKKEHLIEVNSLHSGYLYAEDKYYSSEYDLGDKYAQCGRKNDILKAWLLLTFAQEDIKKSYQKMKDNFDFLIDHFHNDPRVIIRSYSHLMVILWYLPERLRNKESEYNLKFEKETLTKYNNQIKARLAQDKKEPVLIAVQDGLRPGELEEYYPKFFRLLPGNDLSQEELKRLVERIIEIGDYLSEIKN